MSHHPKQRQILSRRRFLHVAGITASLLAFPSRLLAITRVAPSRWSDADTWGGVRPGPEDLVRVRRSVLLDTDAQVAGIVVEAGGDLVFDPDKSVTVETRENVIVKGHLAMRPARPSVVHELVFTDVDESAFVGGGLDPLDTDVGLWVVDAGTLDLRGSRKRAWARATGAVPAGTRKITLNRDPVGWRVGDELVVTPTLPPTDGDSSTAFDVVTIRGVDQRTIKLSKAVSFDHPAVKVGPGQTMTAEVLNLTRNVIVRGTPAGRSHTFIHSTKPSTMRNVLLPHMGPRKGGVKVEGRWPTHFHHAGDGSRASVLAGIVVRDAGSHAFVPHASHGVSFRNCIAYDVQEAPFWWDHTDNTIGADASNDVLWANCVAALVNVGDAGREFRLSGFQMENGSGNVARGCVAVGVQGSVNAAGYHWPEPPPWGVWTFKDCVSHNNRVDGFFSWENDGKGEHDIVNFLSYRNGEAGIEHGAYGNKFHFIGSTVYENGTYGVANHARTGDASRPIEFKNLRIDGAGVTAEGVLLFDNIDIPAAPVRFVDVRFLGVTTPIHIKTSADPLTADFIRPVVGANERDLKPSDILREIMSLGSLIRVQRKDDQSAWQIDHTGIVTEISPFD